VVRKRLPKDNPPLAGFLESTGNDLLQMKKWGRAEPLLRESLAIREKTQLNAWFMFNSQSLLGASLLGQARSASKGEDKESLARAAGLYREAEPLLLKGYEGMKQREKTISPYNGGISRIPQALDRLVELSTATNKPDEAKMWRKELEAAKIQQERRSKPPMKSSK